MNSLNTIIVEGNVVREPTIKETAKGTLVGTFALMSIRAYKKNDGYEKEISFFDVDVWGKLAEICVQNTSKGRGVRVVGRLKQSRWVGEDGKNHSKIAIVAEHVEFKPLFKKTTDELASDADAEAILTEATKKNVRGRASSTAQTQHVTDAEAEIQAEALAEEALVF